MREAARKTTNSGIKSQGHRGVSASGYSLVELMVVVLVILTIAAFAIPQLLAARRSAQQSAAVAFMQNLQTAQEHYYITHGQYAATFAELNGLLAGNTEELPLLREFRNARLRPFHNSAMPALAFLMLPTPEPEQGQPFQGDGSSRPGGQDTNAGGGGGAPVADSPSAGGGSNSGSGTDGGSGSGGSSPTNGGEPGTGSGDSGENGGGAGGTGGSPSNSGAASDRLTLHGYDFVLERPSNHTWRCTAQPTQDAASSYSYFSDQSGVIRRELGRQATSQSAPI